MKNTLTAIAIVLVAGTSSVMALSADDANTEVKKWSAYDVDALQKESSGLNGQDSYPFCIVKQDGKLMRTVFPDASKLGEDVTANAVVNLMEAEIPTSGTAKVTYTWDGKDKGAYIRSIKDMGGTVDGFCGYSYLVSAPVVPAASTSASSTPAASAATPAASGAVVPAATTTPATSGAATTPATSGAAATTPAPAAAK